MIAGGGPAGLMLAAELMLGGTEPVVLERLSEISEIPKGNGLIGQIVPVLDYRGLLDPIRAEATFAEANTGSLGRAATAGLHRAGCHGGQPAAHRGDPAAAAGAATRRAAGRARREHQAQAHELTALVPDEDGVTLEVRGPDGEYSLRAGYLVGCDGAHSLVRKQAGIGFPGITSSEISRIGRVFLPTAVIAPGGAAVEVPGAGRLTFPGVVRTPRGAYSIMPLAMLDKSAPPGLFIVFTSEEDPTATAAGDGPMTLDELRASFRRVLGAELEMAEPQWLTRTVGNGSKQSRALSEGWPGTAGKPKRRGARLRRRRIAQRRPARRGQPRLEARRAGRRPGAGRPAGLLPRRALPGRPAGPAADPGAEGPGGRGRGHRGDPRAVRRAAALPRGPAPPRRGHPGLRRPLSDAGRRSPVAPALAEVPGTGPAGGGERRPTDAGRRAATARPGRAAGSHRGCLGGRVRRGLGGSDHGAGRSRPEHSRGGRRAAYPAGRVRGLGRRTRRTGASARGRGGAAHLVRRSPGRSASRLH